MVATSAVALTGCPGDAVNTNTNMNGRTNMNANSNVAVVVNNNSNMMMNSNTMNSNRWNSNISKEEYEKDKANYEKDRGTSTVGTGVNDSWLWFKTRSALATTADLRESTVNVDVSNEVVTLKGTVGTAEQKKKAEEVAKGINGVKSVTNQLTVAANDSMTNTGSTSNSTNKSNTNANMKK
jgi:osmotically-inducible protein OsmY